MCFFYLELELTHGNGDRRGEGLGRAGEEQGARSSSRGRARTIWPGHDRRSSGKAASGAGAVDGEQGRGERERESSGRERGRARGFYRAREGDERAFIEQERERTVGHGH
jgi:hypothetical protein